MTLTRDALGIFWQGEERPGVIAYGLWCPAANAAPVFPEWAWPDPLHAESRMAGPWAGEPWEARVPWSIVRWDICGPEWPRADRWRHALEATLSALLDQYARIAWFGFEGMFVEPPALFDPERMTGGVWAALRPGGELVCRAELEGRFEPLSDGELLGLRSHVPR